MCCGRVGDKFRSPAVGGDAGTSPVDVEKAELRRKNWTKFVIGNLISTVAVISQISTLDVCFDEYEGDDDDSDIAGDAEFTYGVVLFTLIFGLWVDLFSAFALSSIYQSPVDIKSVHKIPSNDIRHCGGSVLVHFFAPFSWAISYMFGGMASLFYGLYSSCGGQGGEGLEMYLLLSGLFMLFVGSVLFALSAIILPFSCGAPMKCMDQCCSGFRRKVHKHILRKGPLLELFWKLQGSIWSYRTGGLGLVAAVFVGGGGLFGEILSACGSMSPEVVQALADPLA